MAHSPRKGDRWVEVHLGVKKWKPRGGLGGLEGPGSWKLEAKLGLRERPIPEVVS